ncbi:hypothetical protein JTB14_021972 [Gonioctena quinquepunctata]|nr:hypothetical protein JTB14_021972 [Gonioctena quinquepunctata]
MLLLEQHASISEELQDCPGSNQHEDSQKETDNSGKSNDKGVDNGDYAVVLYDYGVFASIKKALIQWREGKYSTKWKNAYYNVQVRRSGIQECDLYIEQHTSISEELQDSVKCNQHEDLQERDDDSTSDDRDRHASISEELQDSVECTQNEDLQETDNNSISDERGPQGIKACNSRALLERVNELFSRYQCVESEESLKSTPYDGELIKKENNDLKSKDEDFLKVLGVDFGITVNKGVLETQNKNKRKRKHVLPSMEDMQSLNSYLKQSRRKPFESLKKYFNVQD